MCLIPGDVSMFLITAHGFASLKILNLKLPINSWRYPFNSEPPNKAEVP